MAADVTSTRPYPFGLSLDWPQSRNSVDRGIILPAGSASVEQSGTTVEHRISDDQ